MRIRTVKPEFWTDEQMSTRTEFARLLALALLNYSDDDGYFLANPILIRGACFPFLDDSKKIPRSIQELSEIGFLEIGSLDDGRQVGKIINFRKHQRIDKPQLSKLKEKSQFQEHSKNLPRIFQEPSKIILGGNGMEQGKGKGKGMIPPTLSDVMEFMSGKAFESMEKGYKGTPYYRFEKTEVPKFYEWYSTSDWKDRDGKQIVNWKLKLLTWVNKWLEKNPPQNIEGV